MKENSHDNLIEKKPDGDDAGERSACPDTGKKSIQPLADPHHLAERERPDVDHGLGDLPSPESKRTGRGGGLVANETAHRGVDLAICALDDYPLFGRGESTPGNDPPTVLAEYPHFTAERTEE